MARVGHLRKLAGRNSHFGNGRSQGTTDVGGLRRRNEEFTKADVQSSGPPTGTKARANGRCPTNRTSAFGPKLPVGPGEAVVQPIKPVGTPKGIGRLPTSMRNEPSLDNIGSA